MLHSERAKRSAKAIEHAVAALGPGPLSEASLQAHIAPLFSRTLAANRHRIYLANHSLGRPLDATEDDVREALALWYARVGDAWDAWNAEQAPPDEPKDRTQRLEKRKARKSAADAEGKTRKKS